MVGKARGNSTAGRRQASQEAPQAAPANGAESAWPAAVKRPADTRRQDKKNF